MIFSYPALQGGQIICGDALLEGTLADVTRPVITIIGQTLIFVPVDGVYNDAGAPAFDNIDGDITGNIVVNNPVDTATPGPYEITYNIQDAAGNDAIERIRTVIVGIQASAEPRSAIGGQYEWRADRFVRLR